MLTVRLLDRQTEGMESAEAERRIQELQESNAELKQLNGDLAYQIVDHDRKTWDYLELTLAHPPNAYSIMALLNRPRFETDIAPTLTADELQQVQSDLNQLD